MFGEFVYKACLTDDVNVKLGNNCANVANIDQLLPNDDLSGVLKESIGMMPLVDIVEVKFDSYLDGELILRDFVNLKEVGDYDSILQNDDCKILDLVICENRSAYQYSIGEFELTVSAFKGGTTKLNVNSDNRNHLVIIPRSLSKENDKFVLDFAICKVAGHYLAAENLYLDGDIGNEHFIDEAVQFRVIENSFHIEPGGIKIPVDVARVEEFMYSDDEFLRSDDASLLLNEMNASLIKWKYNHNDNVIAEDSLSSVKGNFFEGSSEWLCVVTKGNHSNAFVIDDGDRILQLKCFSEIFSKGEMQVREFGHNSFWIDPGGLVSAKNDNILKLVNEAVKMFFENTHVISSCEPVVTNVGFDLSLSSSICTKLPAVYKSLKGMNLVKGIVVCTVDDNEHLDRFLAAKNNVIDYMPERSHIHLKLSDASKIDELRLEFLPSTASYGSVAAPNTAKHKMAMNGYTLSLWGSSDENHVAFHCDSPSEENELVLHSSFGMPSLLCGPIKEEKDGS
ncbi:OLC1v1013074C1 [Oldenlandia corymbosa var. corymbosa]|uniref:OLC1v1013074C1 n=1 Tax=Oldenlandia corymbosa var. corymbosa TaxID=529605 RepID=A0AAV1DZF8_OLDCO|nr:OLC1v1013074C1 [Oldenlandia corymbosa var. corymbosa]